MINMTVQWLGHACFKITHKGYSIVIDPYNSDYTEGYPPLHVTADKLLVSHEHYGHNCREAVTLTGKSERENPFEITSFSVGHDNSGGIMRGNCLVHIFEADGIRIAHMGDIGTVLTGGQASRLSGLDALLVTAGSLTALPSEAVWRLFEELIPNVLIPMHYRDKDHGIRRLETVEKLVGYFEDPSFAVWYDTDSLEITHDLTPQIAVLKCMVKSEKSAFPKFAGWKKR